MKKGVIRGEESNGMLCSEREMGISDEHDGIIELPEDSKVGEGYAKVAGLDDPIIDIAITRIERIVLVFVELLEI